MNEKVLPYMHTFGVVLILVASSWSCYVGNETSQYCTEWFSVRSMITEKNHHWEKSCCSSANTWHDCVFRIRWNTIERGLLSEWKVFPTSWAVWMGAHPSFLQENPPSFLQAAPRVLADSGSLDLLFDLHCNTESVWCCVFGIHGKFVRPIRAAGAEKNRYFWSKSSWILSGIMYTSGAYTFGPRPPPVGRENPDAHSAQKCTRPYCMLIRWNHEEFITLFPQ